MKRTCADCGVDLGAPLVPGRPKKRCDDCDSEHRPANRRSLSYETDFVTPLSWHHDAACTGMAGKDDDPWHPSYPSTRETAAAYARAYEICRTCPVIVRCLTWALDNGVEYGMYGGMTPDERQYMTRKNLGVSA